MAKKFVEAVKKLIEYLFPLKHTCNACGREIFSDKYLVRVEENNYLIVLLWDLNLNMVMVIIEILILLDLI